MKMTENNSFFVDNDVKKVSIGDKKTPNELLKRYIYIEAKSNINKFATELGVSRQFIHGIIAGYQRPSISLAKRICDKLGIKDTRLLFPDGTLVYPDFQSADEILKGEEGQAKDLPNPVKDG